MEFPKQSLLRFRAKLELQASIDALPGNFYVMDLKNRLVFSNKAQRLDLRIDSDIHSTLEAEELQAATHLNEVPMNNNVKIIKEEKACYLIEKVYMHDRCNYYLSYKSPIFSAENKVIGLYGYSIYLPKDHDAKEVLQKKKTLLADFFTSPVIKQLSNLDTFLVAKTENTNESDIDFLELLDSMPGNFYIVDKNCHLVFCNRKQLDTLGLQTLNDALHMDPENIPFDAKSLEEVNLNNQTILTTKKAQEFIEQPIIHKKRYSFLSHKAPLYSTENKKLIGVYGYSVDITDHIKTLNTLEKQNKMLQDMTESQSRFIANLSHDIRTPFAGLMGMIDLMLTSSKPEETKQYGQYAKDAVHELIGYFEKIVQAEKTLNQSGASNQKQTIHLPTFLDNIIKLYLPSAKVKGLEITVDCPITYPITVAATPLSTTLLNIIANAVKYTKAGGITVKASTVEKKGKPFLVFTISDTGPGIPYALRKKIFDPFYRVKQAAESKIKGAGLGLSLAQKNIQKIKGNLKLLPPAAGFGAQFECSIPYEKAQADAAIDTVDITDDIEPIEPDIPTEPTIKQKPIQVGLPEYIDATHIALVEDNAIIAIATTRLIQQDFPKANIRHFDCANAMLSACQEGYQPDLVLLDIGLPDLTGDQLALKLREEQYVNRLTPLVAITGHGHELENSYQLSAFDALLIKPLTAEQIKKLVQRYLTFDKHQAALGEKTTETA